MQWNTSGAVNADDATIVVDFFDAVAFVKAHASISSFIQVSKIMIVLEVFDDGKPAELKNLFLKICSTPVTTTTKSHVQDLTPTKKATTTRLYGWTTPTEGTTSKSHVQDLTPTTKATTTQLYGWTTPTEGTTTYSTTLGVTITTSASDVCYNMSGNEAHSQLSISVNTQPLSDVLALMGDDGIKVTPREDDFNRTLQQYASSMKFELIRSHLHIVRVEGEVDSVSQLAFSVHPYDDVTLINNENVFNQDFYHNVVRTHILK